MTRGKQWVRLDSGVEMLDTPGILWPKFEDQSIGLNLAYTGAVKDDIMDIESLASSLCADLNRKYPGALEERYKVTLNRDMQGWEILEACGRKRGFLISGGEVDLERMAKILLDEYRGGKLGRITLEMPEDVERTAQVFDLLLGDNLQGRKEHIAEHGSEYLDDLDVS